jgi:uncharacterized protein (TIGR00730 family)
VADPAPRVCVYCGSRRGERRSYALAAAAVGARLGFRGADLVYGGGHVGLMGVLADAVLESGREVSGVITEALVDSEVAHLAVTHLHVVDDMPARKKTMYELADAFLTLPGGIGTMEEFFEVLTWGYLGLHPKPMGLLNVDGYYDPLLGFLDHSIAEGLCKASVRELLMVDDDPEAIVDRLLDASPEAALS